MTQQINPQKVDNRIPKKAILMVNLAASTYIGAYVLINSKSIISLLNENNLDVSDNNHMNHLDKKFHSKFINNIKMYLMLIFY